MATVSDSGVPLWTASEVIAHFGDIPIARICTSPPPGEATEADVIRLHDRHDRLFELVDGTLVEKAMGWQESELMVIIATLLRNFVADKGLGKVFGSDGMFRLRSEQIRIPNQRLPLFTTKLSERQDKQSHTANCIRHPIKEPPETL